MHAAGEDFARAFACPPPFSFSASFSSSFLLTNVPVIEKGLKGGFGDFKILPGPNSYKIGLAKKWKGERWTERPCFVSSIAGLI